MSSLTGLEDTHLSGAQGYFNLSQNLDNCEYSEFIDFVTGYLRDVSWNKLSLLDLENLQ